jgi:hypothetical protein
MVTQTQTHLVFKPHSFDDLEESLPKPHAVVCIVEPRETDYRTLEFPFCWGRLPCPVCRDSKIAIGITRLPCIACKANFAPDSRTLQT